MSNELVSAPVPDPDSQAFWSACREGIVSAPLCASCHSWLWPPTERCPYCYSRSTNWKRISNTGTVRSFVGVHRPFHPDFSSVPFVVAEVVVDGTDGRVVLTSVLNGCDDEYVQVGDTVRIVIDTVGTVAIPRFIKN